jgi:hypothetical protein
MAAAGTSIAAGRTISQPPRPAVDSVRLPPGCRTRGIRHPQGGRPQQNQPSDRETLLLQQQGCRQGSATLEAVEICVVSVSTRSANYEAARLPELYHEATDPTGNWGHLDGSERPLRVEGGRLGDLDRSGAVNAIPARSRSPPYRRCGCHTGSRRAARATRETAVVDPPDDYKRPAIKAFRSGVGALPGGTPGCVAERNHALPRCPGWIWLK